jgi:hypothetical protein
MLEVRLGQRSQTQGLQEGSMKLAIIRKNADLKRNIWQMGQYFFQNSGY